MQVLAKQQEPLCLDCFQFSLGRTVRHTIRTKCLIEAGDSVLVALSGGSSSLSLLVLLQEICESKQQAARHGQVGTTLLAVFLKLTLQLMEAALQPLRESDCTSQMGVGKSWGDAAADLCCGDAGNIQAGCSAH